MAPPTVINDLADLVLGRRCLGCDVSAPGLCAPCLARLRGRVLRVPGTSPVAHAALAYEDVGRRLVLAYKEEAFRSLAAPLGWLLADAIWAAMLDSDADECVIVPVPGHRRSTRGFDALGGITKEAMRALSSAGVRVTQERLLRNRTDYAALKGLGRSARRSAVSGAFIATARPLTCSSVVVVVDDVITTGATIDAAISALASASVPVTAVAVVAATASPGR